MTLCAPNCHPSEVLTKSSQISLPEVHSSSVTYSDVDEADGFSFNDLLLANKVVAFVLMRFEF